MNCSRRRFLGVAGLSAFALAGGAALAGTPAPRAATRWGMAIDLPKCRLKPGCTDCIAACHKAHNVPQFAEPAHAVKWIWEEPFERVFPEQTSRYGEPALLRSPTLVFCNHCENPPCVRVCPTQATWKRPDGIVMMDWHRCIGCRYCMAACPYGSRSFNWLDPRPVIQKINPAFPTRTKGVVEKCNFCEERLATGDPPACAAACPERALTFGNLLDPGSGIRELLRTRYSIRRRSELGTDPQIYYLV